MTHVTDTTPWYKQFWPWFVIALPASAVVAGLTTLVIAIQHQPDIVRDDWYKDGLAIQIRKDRTERARTLGIEFAYTYDHETRKLHLTPTGLDTKATPILTVSLQHPTLQKRDIESTAAFMPEGNYSALLERQPQGLYHAQIDAPGSDWQIDGDIQFSDPAVSGRLSVR